MSTGRTFPTSVAAPVLLESHQGHREGTAPPRPSTGFKHCSVHFSLVPTGIHPILHGEREEGSEGLTAGTEGPSAEGPVAPRSRQPSASYRSSRRVRTDVLDRGGERVAAQLTTSCEVLGGELEHLLGAIRRTKRAATSLLVGVGGDAVSRVRVCWSGLCSTPSMMCTCSGESDLTSGEVLLELGLRYQAMTALRIVGISPAATGSVQFASIRWRASARREPHAHLAGRPATPSAGDNLLSVLPLDLKSGEAGENLQPFDMLRQLFLRACIQSHERAEERAICNDNRHTDVCSGAHVLTGRQHCQVRVGRTCHRPQMAESSRPRVGYGEAVSGI